LIRLLGRPNRAAIVKHDEDRDPISAGTMGQIEGGGGDGGDPLGAGQPARDARVAD